MKKSFRITFRHLWKVVTGILKGNEIRACTILLNFLLKCAPFILKSQLNNAVVVKSDIIYVKTINQVNIKKKKINFFLS